MWVVGATPSVFLLRRILLLTRHVSRVSDRPLMERLSTRLAFTAKRELSDAADDSYRGTLRFPNMRGSS